MRLTEVWMIIAYLPWFVPLLSAQSVTYKLSDSIAVGWANADFYALDPVNRLLYGAGAQVVNIDKGIVDHEVSVDAAKAEGFIIARDLGRGMIRDGTIFDLASGSVVSRVKALGDASVYDSSTGKAFLLHDTIAVIDIQKGVLVRKISVPGAGESAVADGYGRVYLNLYRKNAIAVLDTKLLRVVATYSVLPAKGPMGLSIDTQHHRLFAACEDQVAVLDAVTGRLVTTVPAPGHSDENAFDPGTGLLFEPGGAKGLTIIHEDTPEQYSVVQTLIDPRVLSIKVVVDPLRHRAYMPLRVPPIKFSYLVLAPFTEKASF